MDRKLLQKLASEPLPPVLLVHGPETFWQDQVYGALKGRSAQENLGEWNWSVFHGAKDFDLEVLLGELATLPWGGSQKIVVLKEAELVPAPVMEKLANWLQHNSFTHCLALFFNRVDQRWKYLKVLRQLGEELECVALEGERLLRYLSDYCREQGRKMAPAAAQFLAARAGRNLQFLHNELDKLFAYTEGREEITVEDVKAISSFWPAEVENHAIFQMTESIVQKNRKRALEVLGLLLADGEQPLRILPLIERQLRLVLAAKTGSPNLQPTAEQMGESSVVPLKKIRAQAQKFSLDELMAGFAAVVQADAQLKLGAPGKEVLTDLIIRLTSG